MDDQEAYDYYADPAHLIPAGPGRKPARPATHSSMASVRFSPEDIEAVKDIAAEEGITVSSWIRRLVREKVEPPRMVEVACDGLDEPLLIPESALAAITAAALPALIRHGSVSLQIGTPRQQTGAERPAGLIEGSARRGEPKALRSSLPLLPGQTFSCPHFSVGNVVSASCETCGPLEGVA